MTEGCVVVGMVGGRRRDTGKRKKGHIKGRSSDAQVPVVGAWGRDDFVL